ncbi:MAG: hypothetical protein R6V67_07170 [Spirochaetia bacterium]
MIDMKDFRGKLRVKYSGVKKIILVSVISSVLAVLPASAFAPSFVAGGSAENINSSVDGIHDSSLWLDLYGIGSWRTTFEEGGYTAVSGNLVLEKNVLSGADGVEAIQDKESLEGLLGLPAPGGRTLFKAGFTSSIKDMSYGTTFRPRWSAEYTYSSEERGSVEPYLRYSGYYLYQELGYEDRTNHTASLGISYDPSIKRGYRIEASGKVELWEDDYTDYLKENTTYDGPAEEQRRDVIASGEAEINGLAGYFADWALTLNGGARISNDDKIFDETEKKEFGNSSVFGGVEGTFSWSPRRGMRLSSVLYADGRLYSDRNEDPAENTAAGSLITLDAGGDIEVDWTPDDRVYFTLGLSGGRRFYNTGYGSWRLGVSGGMEIGF